MQTLREIVAFTGVTGIAGLHTGDPFRSASLRSAAGMVPLLSVVERTHMRAMITRLQLLPPISLTAELVGDSSGGAPYEPEIRVQPSGGVVIQTSISFSHNGQSISDPTSTLADGSDEVPPNGDYALLSFDDPGPYVAAVSRIGITSTGLTTLRQDLSFTVTGSSTTTPPHPAPPTPAQPTCAVVLDLTGFGSAAAAQVSGGGFLPSEPVAVTLDGAVAATVQANVLGGYDATVDFVQTSPPSAHQVHAHGMTSGRNSNTAGFTA